MIYNHDMDSFIISNMTYSFSRISSFYNCPYEWRSVYIDCESRDGSAMAQFGSLIHKILEMYFKGELDFFELTDYYEKNFDNFVTYEFPANPHVSLYNKYYQAGIEYLDNFTFDFKKYEVLGIEKRVTFNIGNYDFVGCIDLLLGDKVTGEIIILDHKSASIGILKSGKIAKKDREHFEDFKRQLYLYSIPIIEEYGKVDKLKWNLFKEQKFIEIPWKEDEYNESIRWAEQTIKNIENETEWNINKEMIEAQEQGKYPPFYCMNLCSQRFRCGFRNEYLGQLKENKIEKEEFL